MFWDGEGTLSETNSAVFFQHPLAAVETAHVGRGTRISPFAHVLPGAHVGEDCTICDHTLIESNVYVGDRVTIKAGAKLLDGAVLEDDVLIGPNATLSNDLMPPGKPSPLEARPHARVKRGASVGANATLLPVTIGEEAVVGAGAVVTRDVPPRAIVVGNPASIIGYVDTEMRQVESKLSPTGVGKSKVRGVILQRLSTVEDLRGNLSVAEVQRDLPFDIRRYFVVYGVSSKEVRGEHAHRTLQQFVVCVHGSCHIVVDDGITREEYKLDDPSIGVYIPPMVWGTQYKYSPDGVLLVLASAPYDPDDYIRNYEEFLRLSLVPVR